MSKIWLRRVVIVATLALGSALAAAGPALAAPSNYLW